VQAMWAAPLCQTFLHLLYDKEILEEPIILQWYSRTHGEGEDSGFEPQRKQLRQQVRHSWHVSRYVSMSLRHSVYVELAFFVYWVRFFPRKPRCAGIRILVVPDVITPTLFHVTKHFALKLLSFSRQIRSRFGLINDCKRSSSVVTSIVFSFVRFLSFKTQYKLWDFFSKLLFCY